jgi:hypothetical protein
MFSRLTVKTDKDQQRDLEVQKSKLLISEILASRI